MSGLVFFGKQFIGLWAGNEYGEAYYVVLLLIIPGTIPLIQNVGIEIQRSLNKHKFRSIAYLIMAVINFAISVILCQRFGAIGSSIGTAISLVVANGFIMNVYYQKRCGIDVPAFWKNIARVMCGMLPAFLIGFLIYNFAYYSSWIPLMVWIMIYTAVYCLSVWMLSMNQYEKELAASLVKKVMPLKRLK